MKRNTHILIIDDDEFFTSSLSDFLKGRGFKVSAARNGKDGVEKFAEMHPPIVLLDQELPEITGISVCRRILEINSAAKVIFITAFATVRYAVEAMQAGAFNYLSKPFELDELLLVIEMAMKSFYLEGRLKVEDYTRERERKEKKLVGSSEWMKRIKDQIQLAAHSDANVLITGETGVGKNVAADLIHQHQNERETFLSINCSAIPENLIEAEYFGHEKGVFTGADFRREGIFELADGGTLVLDEIGDVPMHLQSKLLTVLEDKSIRRIGSGLNIPVDVRIIATTNLDLEEAVEDGRFRRDLYYRLAVFTIHIPPLREHPEDIPEIAEYFIRKYCKESVRIPDRHLNNLKGYHWPGNVRELRNIIERASLLRRGNEIRPADLLLEEHSVRRATVERRNGNHRESISLEELKKRQIAATLETCGWNKTQSAKKLGISLSTLKRKIKELHLNPPRLSDA